MPAKSGSSGKMDKEDGNNTINSSPKKNALDSQKKAESETVASEEGARSDNQDFLNFEDFLQLDNLPLLTVGKKIIKIKLKIYRSLFFFFF